MIRCGVVAFLILLVGCKGKKKQGGAEETTFDYQPFSERFQQAKLPYTITDTFLLINKDTSSLQNPEFLSYLADSLKVEWFDTKKVKLVPLARIEVPKKESYFIVKGVGGGKKAALMFVFDKDKKFSTVFPFLLPDEEPSTGQVSFIDKGYTITRSTIIKKSNDVNQEKKEAYIYNTATNGFTLIMTDKGADDNKTEIINPIDTFSRKHPFAGDYVKDKRNLVSIRDTKSPNQLSFFIHFEKDEDCTGELKGTALMTSSKTAVFRQGGDPCVLELSFSGSSVTFKEMEGCGSHRGVKCIFEGTFQRKKEAKAKTSTKTINKNKR